MIQSHKDGYSQTLLRVCKYLSVLTRTLCLTMAQVLWNSNYSWAITHDALHSEDTSGPTLHPAKLNHSPAKSIILEIVGGRERAKDGERMCGGGAESKTNSRGAGEKENKAGLKDEDWISHKRPFADCFCVRMRGPKRSGERRGRDVCVSHLRAASESSWLIPVGDSEATTAPLSEVWGQTWKSQLSESTTTFRWEASCLRYGTNTSFLYSDRT